MKRISFLLTILALCLIPLGAPFTEAMAQPDERQIAYINWGDAPETVVGVLGEPDERGTNFQQQRIIKYYHGTAQGFIVFVFDRDSDRLASILVLPDLTSPEAAAQSTTVGPETLPDLAEAEGFLADFLESRGQNHGHEAEAQPSARKELNHEVPVVELGARQHNGFFLRLLGGVGSGKTVEEDIMGSDMEFEGAAGVFRFQIGGAISRNLSLYGEIGAFAMSEPDFTWQGSSGKMENADLSVTDIGAGLSYYFMPANLYLSTTLTISRNKIEAEGIGEGETESGLGVYLAVGKEWWVADRWGIGVAIFGNFSQSKDKGDSVEYTIKNRAFGVLFSATFD